jgi:hypothetical protein
MSRNTPGPSSHPTSVRAPLGQRLVLLGVLAFVTFNAAGYVAYRALSPGGPRQPTDMAAPASSEVATTEIRALRIAGLDAIERGDYEEAARLMTRAAKAGDTSPDAVRLLALSQDLLHRYGADRTSGRAAEVEARATSPAAAPQPPPPREEVVPREERLEIQQAVRSARRAWGSARPARSARPVEPPAALGPDEGRASPEALPPQPTTTSLRAFAAAETTAPADSPVALPPDVTPPPQADALSVGRLPPSPAPPPTLRRTSPSPAAPQSAVPRPREGVPRPAGELEVLSPNVFGEVWIDGRGYGYAPRVVRGLRAGNVRVEIRVDGVTRRSRVVNVPEQGRRTLNVF